jgi:DNA replication initiation complex subunit (GINS family)
MQQQQRNRYRRQDVYDLRFLLESGIDDSEKRIIHRNLIIKAKARGIEPDSDSLASPELRRRAQKEYQTLADEIDGDLPDFNESFELIESFYRSLPWV